MIELQAVVALDFAKVMGPVLASILIFFLFLARFYLNSVNLSGHNKGSLLFFVPTIVAAVLLLIFARFFGSFRLVLKRSRFLGPAF